MKEILKTSGPDKKPFFLPPSSRCSTPSWDPYHSSHSVTAALAGPLRPAGPGGGRRHTWTAAAGTTDSLPISSYSRRADCVSDRSAALTLLLAHGRLVGMHVFRAAGWPVWGSVGLCFWEALLRAMIENWEKLVARSKWKCAEAGVEGAKAVALSAECEW